MTSNLNDPKKPRRKQEKNQTQSPQAQDNQKQPGEQDRQNLNKAGDAQLNQASASQGQHGSARNDQGLQDGNAGGSLNQSERDENMESNETSSRQPGRSGQ